MNEVIIGVDGGTTAVKAVAFDLTGEVRAVHHESVPVHYGGRGEAEQDMALLWDAVVACLADVAVQLGDATVLGIGLTGQGDGAWLVDADGEPARRAANWMDGRAAGRVDEWNADGRGRRLLDVTGTTVFGGLFPVLIEELAETDPDAVAKGVSASGYAQDSRGVSRWSRSSTWLAGALALLGSILATVVLRRRAAWRWSRRRRARRQ